MDKGKDGVSILDLEGHSVKCQRSREKIGWKTYQPRPMDTRSNKEIPV